MKNRTIADKVAIVAAIFAAYFSYQLLIKHMTGASTVWFDQGCHLSALGDKANCAAVLNSPYSYIPPKFEGKSSGTSFPAAFLGLIYYAVLFIFLVGVGRPSRERRWLLFLPIAGVALGLLGSAYFIFVMFSKIGEWCVWCAVTHGLNFIIAACLLRLWFVAAKEPSLTTATTTENANDNAPPSPSVVMLPSTRQLFLTFTSAALVIYMSYLMMGMLRVGKLQAEIGEYKAELDRVRADVQTLFAGWQAAPKKEYKPAADDPTRMPAKDGKPYDVVIFSDFECPSCSRMATFLEDRVQPLFGGHLRLTYKHFPLGMDCNPLVKKTIHPNACTASRLAEAARSVGGNDAFWKAHDFLFSHQQNWKKKPPTKEEVSEASGVSVDALQTALESQAPSTRIADDVKLAEQWGVQGTPTIFVDGKLIPPIAKMSESFWNELANHYWNTVAQQPRPEATKLSHLPPIQGNPGPQGGK